MISYKLKISILFSLNEQDTQIYDYIALYDAQM